MQISITLAQTANYYYCAKNHSYFKPQLLLRNCNGCTSHNYFALKLIFQRDSLLSVDQVECFPEAFELTRMVIQLLRRRKTFAKYQSPCLIHHAVSQGLPRWLIGREFTFRDTRRCRLDPGSGRSLESSYLLRLTSAWKSHGQTASYSP